MTLRVVAVVCVVFALVDGPGWLGVAAMCALCAYLGFDED